MPLALLAIALFQTASNVGPDARLEWSATFEAVNVQSGDQFGRAVSAGYERAVVSAWRKNGNTGGAEVYRWADGKLEFEAELTPGDGFQGSMCGASATIDEEGHVVVLSALGDNSAGTSSGAAYVFRRIGSTWFEQAKLVAPDAAPNDRFSSAVAVGDDTLVIGAAGVDVAPFYYNAGAVYVYRYDGTVWNLETRLVLPPSVIDIGDNFGAQLSLSGNSFAVGVPAKDNEFGDNSGAVYLYTRGASGWELEARVTAADQAVGDGFGRSVALSGNRLIAASTSDVGVAMAGVAYAFERGRNAWLQTAKFTAPVLYPFDFFGETLALRGNTAVVSSRLTTQPLATAGHLFELGPRAATWTETLTFPITSAFTMASNAIALGGCFALFGEALHADNLSSSPSHVHAYETRAKPSMSLRR